MTPTVYVVTALIAAIAGVAASLLTAYMARPKTRAETENIKAAATVSVSSDARAWTQLFVDRADHAEVRADAAEARAAVAETRANAAVDRAEAAEVRSSEIEAGLIECYGYVRQLRDEIRRTGGHVPALPVRLEALWRTTGS